MNSLWQIQTIKGKGEAHCFLSGFGSADGQTPNKFKYSYCQFERICGFRISIFEMSEQSGDQGKSPFKSPELKKSKLADQNAKDRPAGQTKTICNPSYDLLDEHEDTNDSKTDDLDSDNMATDVSGPSEYDLDSEFSCSNQSSGSESKLNTALSKAGNDDVENVLSLKRGFINSMVDQVKKLNANDLLKNYTEAPNDLVYRAFKLLRGSFQSKRYSEKGVSEAIRSFHIGRVLDDINLWFLQKFNVDQDQLEMAPEWPVARKPYKGKIDYAIFRTGKKIQKVSDWKRATKKYFYVVEMKAEDPLDGLRQGMIYLDKLKIKDQNASKVSGFRISSLSN